MAKNTEIANVATGIAPFEAMLPPAEVQEQMSREMAGLKMPPPPRIKVPAGGAVAFEVPTDDPENPDSVKELRCIVLAHHPVNRCYLKGLDEGGVESAPPDCLSYDGVEGVNYASGEITLCETCPLNQFGSGRNGVGKMCSNRHRLYLLLESEPLPYILEVPPTGLTALATYIVNVIYRYKCGGTTGAVTRITLKKAESKSGVKYSEVQFAFGGKADPEVSRAAAMVGVDIEKRMKQHTTEMATDFLPFDDEVKPAR